MPTNPDARRFRPGLPMGGDEQQRQRPIPSNFPSIAPGVYDRENPSPYSFKLPAFTPVRPAAALMQEEEYPTGQPLPLGAPVPGKPGLNETGEATPAGNGAFPQSAPRSKYTMTSAPTGPGGNGSRMNDPAYRQTAASGTAAALAAIFGSPPGQSGPRGGYDPAGEMGDAGALLQAADGLERQRVGYAARDALGRPSARSFNARGEMLDQSSNAPLGTRLASDVIISPFDPPEVRANKQRYAEKLIREAAAKDPAISPNGKAPSTQEMAGAFQRMMQEAGQPRLRTLGVDSQGRPVEGTVDRNGNFSRIAPERDGGESGVQQITIGKKNYFYHADSKRYFNEEGQPIVFAGGFDPHAVLGEEQKGPEGKPAAGSEQSGVGAEQAEPPTLSPAEAAKLPKGTKFKTTDGRILTKN